MSTRFGWYELRSKAPADAAAFYSEVVGADVREDGGLRVVRIRDRVVGEIGELPAQAAARGAPSHWLGHIAVGDVEAIAAQMLAEGAERLGPTRRTAAGATVVGLRDPFGAAVALTDAEPAGELAWHQHNSRDHARSMASYGALLGWRVGRTVDLGGEIGSYQTFSWDAAGPAIGGMVSSARLPHVHCHWLFSFEVDDLDRALAIARARGALVAGAASLPDGSRTATCDDPTGAAFALRERAAR